jgi:hypothetical protein
VILSQDYGEPLPSALFRATLSAASDSTCFATRLALLVLQSRFMLVGCFQQRSIQCGQGLAPRIQGQGCAFYLITPHL